ncbi:MAG: pyridoxamine 5'-phosphate oxidase family protein [Acidimicrobiales bacterium]
MATRYDELSDAMISWIDRQPMFFVGTAPLAGDGHVNVSPKGMAGTLSVIDPTTVAYLDLTGSGIETVAHLAENGRITLMWCAFEGPARIVRVQGTGTAVLPGDDRWDELVERFTPSRGARAIIVVSADRVSDSCGFSVPLMQFEADRTRLSDWTDNRSDDELVEYRATKNAVSIDGLPGLTPA